MSPNSLAVAGIIITAVVTLFPEEIKCLIFGFCSEPPVVQPPPDRPPTPLPKPVWPDPSVHNVNENSPEPISPPPPPSSRDIPGRMEPLPREPNRSEPAREKEAAGKLKVGGRAWIKSRSTSVTIQLGSCNSTLISSVDAGRTVKLIDQSPRQSPCSDRFFLIGDENGEVLKVLGWISEDRLEPQEYRPGRKNP
jgi:hypothetical protein